MRKSGTRSFLFPLPFLREYISLLESQITFFDSKTLKNALTYQDRLESTVKTYRQEAREYSDALLKSYSGSLDKKISSVV